MAVTPGIKLIWGVWHDAKYLADHITTQRGYLAYKGPQENKTGHQ